jgi:amino acid adenylation domain-containing protein
MISKAQIYSFLVLLALVQVQGAMPLLGGMTKLTRGADLLNALNADIEQPAAFPADIHIQEWAKPLLIKGDQMKPVRIMNFTWDSRSWFGQDCLWQCTESKEYRSWCKSYRWTQASKTCQLFDLVYTAHDGHAPPDYRVTTQCGPVRNETAAFNSEQCSDWCTKNAHSCCTFHLSGSSEGICSGSKSTVKPARDWILDVSTLMLIAWGWFCVLQPLLSYLWTYLRNQKWSISYNNLHESNDLSEAALGSIVPAEWVHGKILYSGGQLPAGHTIQELFWECANTYPHNVALIGPNMEQMTYAELRTASSLLSGKLRAAGVKPDDLVALMTDRSLDMVAGMLGILASGAAYVPMSPTLPKTRLESMTDDIFAKSKARVVVVPSKLVSHAQALFGEGVVFIEVNTLEMPGDSPVTAPMAGKFPYAIFTSGSTGKPKGVLMGQRAVMTMIRAYQEANDINAESVSLQLTTFTWDIHGQELWPFLLAGAKVVLPPNDSQTNFKALEQFVERTHPTHAGAVPTITSLYLKRHSFGEAIRYLWVSGEALPRDVAQLVFSKHPDVTLYNWYGPTETAVWTTVTKVDKNDAESTGASIWPIGQPFAERECYILNESRTEIINTVGTTGELFVGGICLAEGYINDEEKTNNAFVSGLRSQLGLPDCAEQRLYKTGDLVLWNKRGELEFKGRNDSQVKVNGLRIELGEIEAVLRQAADVDEAAVVVADGTTLVAYHSGKGQEQVMRAKCEEMLAPYMVPKAFFSIDSWPRTSSAKIDRNALKAQAAVDLKESKVNIDSSDKEEAGLDSLGLMRLTQQAEMDEEMLTLNMKAVASFLIHFMHFVADMNLPEESYRLPLKINSTDPIQNRYVNLSNLSDTLFVMALAMTDRHGGQKAGPRDIGLFVIWMEYLWVFPFLLMPLAQAFGLEFGAITGWFLLALVYCRIAYIVLNGFKLSPPTQILLVLLVWAFISLMVTSEGPTGWTWGGIPVGIGCVRKTCNPDLPEGGVVETLGKIFVNGGLGSQPAGLEFGYFAIYTKMFPMIAQYLLFFHYGTSIMENIRLAHKWVHKKLNGNEVAMNVVRILLVGATTVYPNDWMVGPVTTGFFNGANLQRLFNFIGALAMMFSLYKCGLNLRRAGETILGYFIVGYGLPGSVFLKSIGYEMATKVDSSMLGYPIEVLLCAGFVLGWLNSVSMVVSAIVIGQFKFLASMIRSVHVSSSADGTKACRLR